MAGVPSLAALIANLTSFPGFIVTIDTIPPFVIPFPFAPERYDDNWTAEYETVSSPGSRYQYPIFKGCSIRDVRFIARFDQNYPYGSGAASDKILSDKLGILSNNLGTDIILADEIANIISMFEKLKLPKQNVSQIAQGALGQFVKVNPGQSDPSPPLCLLVVNPFRYYLGYMADARITHLRYNTLMMPTRIQVDCRFIVTPDLIFTTVEDLMRETNILKGWFAL